jgi:molybdopterin synthase sulfur carrier subunit
MTTVTVKYFALFRERAGCESEQRSAPNDVASLYRELQPRLGLEPRLVRAAVNGEFVSFDRVLSDNDEVVFIPPVAGG